MFLFCRRNACADHSNNVNFVRRDDGIHHFWAAEMLYAIKDGKPRHMDLLWPLWNALDLTPEGRGADWYPALSYDD